MAVNLSPVFNDAQLDSSGNPASGFLLFTYVAGSATKQTTYKDSAAGTAHDNPIVLNSRGEPSAPIWLTAGQTYKFRLCVSTESDPPSTSVRDVDNVSGVNDTTVTIDQWEASGLTPTYVSATQFTLVGDQTSAFHVGRKLKITDAGGTKYCRITVSAFTVLTTVTVEGDSLATPTSAVSYGLITRTNTSLPAVEDDELIVVDPADPTKRARLDVVNVTTATTRVLSPMDKDSTIAPAEDITRPFNVTLAASVGSNILTIALKTRDGGDPSAGDPCFIPFRNATAATGDYTVLKQTAALSIAIPDTATLGTVNADMARLYVYAVNDGGVLKLGVYNPVSGTGNTVTLKSLNVGDVQSSTVIGTGSDSAQTLYTDTAGVTSKAICWLGFVEIVQATAGTWATAPSLVTLAGNGVKYTGDLVQVQTAISTGSSTTSSTDADVTNATVSVTPASRCNLLECHIDYHQVCANQTATTAGSTATPTDGTPTAYRTAKTIKGTDTASEIIVQANGAFHFYTKPDSTSAQVVKLRHASINNSDSITTDDVGIVVKEIFA